MCTRSISRLWFRLGAHTGPVQTAVFGGAEVVVVTIRAVGFIGEAAFAGGLVAEGRGLALVWIWAIQSGCGGANPGRAFFGE